MMTTKLCDDQAAWDASVQKLHGHPLQLWGWGAVKAAHNWRVERILLHDDEQLIGCAQILYRPLPGGYSFAYVPRGPVLSGGNLQSALDALAVYVKRKRAILVTIEPHWREFRPRNGWVPTDQTILIPHTMIIDLTLGEDELLKAIVRKRRYDIRRGTSQVSAIRRVKTDKELSECLDIYRQTAERAGFALHGDDYYIDIFHNLGQHCLVSAAFDAQGSVIAFSWTAVSEDIAFELYGGSSQIGNRLMANYALKWWVIGELKRSGVREYDLNGLMNDGISHFKRSFSDHDDYLVGTYQKSLSPLASVWKLGLPLAKKASRLMRR